jgi:hypothetical protein
LRARALEAQLPCQAGMERIGCGVNCMMGMRMCPAFTPVVWTARCSRPGRSGRIMVYRYGTQQSQVRAYPLRQSGLQRVEGRGAPV